MLRGLNRNRPKYKVVVAVFGKPISNTCYIKYLKNLFLKIEEVTGILSPALLFIRGRKNKTEGRNKLSCGRSQSSILIPFVVAPRRLLKTVTDLSINHLHRLYRIPTWLLRQVHYSLSSYLFLFSIFLRITQLHTLCLMPTE